MYPQPQPPCFLRVGPGPDLALSGPASQEGFRSVGFRGCVGCWSFSQVRATAKSGDGGSRGMLVSRTQTLLDLIPGLAARQLCAYWQVGTPL